MMERRIYKDGFVFVIRTIQFQDGGWTATLDIEHRRHKDVTTRFEIGQVFPAEEAALAAAIQLGEHKIDFGYIHGFVASPRCVA
jgi:hypothetical protein